MSGEGRSGPRGRGGPPRRRGSSDQRRGASDQRRGSSDQRRSSQRPRRPGDDRGSRTGGRPGSRPGPRRAPTAAQRRAAEVNAGRQPRAERTPEEERERLAERTTEQWIDEGDVRDEASRAASRAQAPARRPAKAREVDPDDAAQLSGSVTDRRRADVLAERLAKAQHALDRDRLDEARRIALPIAREAPGVAAVHEVLGLVAYRSGRWKQAVTELEQAQSLRPNVELLPVLADAYRGLSRWRDVERLWSEIKSLSPAHEVLAEGRIVAAGALADRGELAGALDVMAKATATPKRVREHHLRQWYVIADLHDRAGDTLEATRWFERVASHDRDFVDVSDRLRALGR